MTDIGDRFKKIRKLLKLSQPELGEKIGLSGQGVSNVERNKSFMTTQILTKLVVELNVNLNYLIAGVGEPILSGQQKFEGDIKSSIMQEVECILKAKGII